MYFKKLEMVGFKSFMDKTVLNFEPGITAIVGPNGCGKSNILDAIRWVLGEQSAKSLRGLQMEDVIFNGTDVKLPLGMAEVNLVFDNEKKYFSLDHDEVVVSRRIFRSGESEYLLNKTLVRLKDIQDLFMGTGIGSESYSIVAQGKVDLVLSSRPEDRRLIFDEASGITKYKAQKKETLKKLEETETNLLRINDIITEVKRSIGYLERQANKARRYQATFEELKIKEINLAILERNNLAQERFEVSKQVEALKKQEELLQIEIKDKDCRLFGLNNELKSLEENISQTKNLILNLEGLIQRNVQGISFNRQSIKELENTKAYIQTQMAEAKERLRQDEEKLNQQKEEQLRLKNGLAEKSLALKDNEAKLENFVSSIKVSFENITRAKKNILEFATKTSHLKNELTELRSEQQVYFARKKRLEIEKAKVGEEMAQVFQNLDALNCELQQMEKEYKQLILQMSGLKQELETEIKTRDMLSQDIEALERQKLSLISQKEFLEKLKSEYDDISESMKALIYLDKLPGEKISGLVVKIEDYRQTNNERSNSLEAGFRLSGEAKPIDLDTQRVNLKIKQIEEKLSVLKNNEASLKDHIQLLSQTIQDLNLKEQERQLALANKKIIHNTVQEEHNKISQEYEIVVLELSDVGNELSNLEQKLNNAGAHLSELEQENKTLDNIIYTEQENINLNSKVKEEVLIVITQVKTEIENLNKNLASCESGFKVLEEATRKETENILNQETKLKEIEDKSGVLVDEISGLEEKIIILRSDLESQKSSLFKDDKRYKEASQEVEEMVKKINEKKQNLEPLRDRGYELQMAEKDIDFKCQSIKERLLSSYKIDLDMQIKNLYTEVKDVQVHLQESLEVALTELPAQNGSVVNLSESNSLGSNVIEGDSVGSEDVNEQLYKQIQSLKEKLDSYGTVNLVAIQEYDELKKRYDFLTSQQTDLIKSKESLEKAIQKINRATKRMFIETFEKVNEEFRNYFRFLFNGGDVKVYLIDEHDPLESGIEIICRPPGKKLQNILLLSGGEKALSAIALIFAIFKVKPPPFCILDEIDAALDESNVDRFGQLLQEFATTSQFIVITHNKRTIANADIMYGITMQESGVSKIVSVKFADDKLRKQKYKQEDKVQEDKVQELVAV